jgi:hypothetical protein
MRTQVLAVVVCLIASFTFVAAQQSSNPQEEKTKSSEATCPMHDAHSHGPGPSAAMNERSEKGMGFSQTATAHHFLIKPDGGVIQVEVNDPTDITDRDIIRKHLAHIAHAFRDGDFNIPTFVHDTVPPGVEEMKRFRDKIEYSFEKTPAGGRIVIITANQESVAGIHKFLRFQIKEHKTGDPTEGR